MSYDDDANEQVEAPAEETIEVTIGHGFDDITIEVPIPADEE